MHRKHLSLSLTLVVVGSVFVGCVADKVAGNAAAKEFFAPDFHRFDDTRLQDGMWRLGKGVQDLDDTFKAEGLTPDDLHARVLANLELMAAAADAVNKPGQKKSHQNIAMNIDKLVVDIAAAKTAAEANDYAAARVLPSSCLACHEGGGGGPQKTSP